MAALPRATRLGAAACALMAASHLLMGLSGGLARLGWPLPTAALAGHGALLVCGFFGSLISLERAVALRHPAGLLAPLAGGGGGLLLWAAGRPELAALAWGGASLALTGLYLWAGHSRAWSLHLGVQALAALAWGAGVWAWSHGQPAAASVAWMAFLVGTIAGERRELMQFVNLGPAARRSFVLVVGLGAAAVGMAVLGAPTAVAQALWWAACAGLAAWLLRWDPAPRQWRRPGWVGHTAVCLGLGYAWLAVAALLGLGGLLGLLRPEGAAALAPHALLLGFVFAMVFGHAPIMLPALAGLRPHHGALRGLPTALPIWLLAASLVARGAALQTGDNRLLGLAGAGHALAIALFAAAMAHAVWHGRPNRGAPGPPPA